MVSPASPYLASTLLNLTPHVQPQPPASSGSFAIDTSALEGGYRYGEITSIAGPTGTSKTLLGYHAIASHLLTENEPRGEGRQKHRAGGEVALIDTTGGFSVIGLRNVLIFRLRARWQRRARSEDERAWDKKEDFVEDTAEMLGRVRVMRVFDLIGVMEALGEIGEKEAEKKEDKQGQRKREVEDSEDDDEDGGEEVGMQRETGDDGQIGNEGVSVGMIVIDTITNVASSVVSRSAIQGQALHARYMRSLQHLTARQQICTILLNSAVGLGTSTTPQHRVGVDDNVSVFATSLGKPALGKIFTYLIDTSIFLSLIPKTQEDATTAYGDLGQGRTWSKATVLEVLKDKAGTREGRWASFEVVDDVKLVPCLT